MTKIWGVPHNRRATKFKNFIRIQRAKGGGMVAASWPRKGQYDKSPAGRLRSAIFGQVQHWTSRPLPFEMLDALTMAVGTPYLARDILTKNAYGRLTELHFKDGRIIFPEAIMSAEAQAFLDSISHDIGSMLIRTGKGWAALLPGPNATVLQAHGPEQIPSWTPLAPAGGGGSMVVPANAVSGSSTNSDAYGILLRPLFDFSFEKIALWMQTGGTYAIRVTLAVLDGGTVTEILYSVLTPEHDYIANSVRDIGLPTKITVEPGVRYGLFFSAETDGTPKAVSYERQNDPVPGLPNIPNTVLVTGHSPIGVGTVCTVWDSSASIPWFAAQLGS